jgi:hypothetical protein
MKKRKDRSTTRTIKSPPPPPTTATPPPPPTATTEPAEIQPGDIGHHFHRLSASEIGRRCGISRQYAGRLLKAGHAPAAIIGMINQRREAAAQAIREQAEHAGHASTETLAAAQLRNQKAIADKNELEVRALRARYVEVKPLQEAWDAMLPMVEQNLSRLADDLTKGACKGIPECDHAAVRAFIDGELQRAMQVLEVKWPAGRADVDVSRDTKESS